RISVAESIDAMNAVAAAGLEQARLREALAATLIKDEADRAIFDETFTKFFAAPPGTKGKRRHPDHPGMQESAATGGGRPGHNPPLRKERQQKNRKKRDNKTGQSSRAPDERKREPAEGTAKSDSSEAADAAVPSEGERHDHEQGHEGARLAR